MNNVDAAVVLLKNGANKDMQNNKVSKGAALIAGAVQGLQCTHMGTTWSVRVSETQLILLAPPKCGGRGLGQQQIK